MSSAPPPQPVALVRATAQESKGARLTVAGLSVLERSAKQLSRLGYRVVVAADAGADLPELPHLAGVEVRELHEPADLPALRAELGHPLEVPGDVVRATGRLEAEPLAVHDQPSRRRAEDAIFAELLRGDLGFVARTLNKPLSFRLTRYVLCHLPVTPNQVTLLAGLVGLAGAALIAFGGAVSMPWGFLLAHLQSVLDGCDGELARVRLQQSALGEWLDTVVDDALNLVLTGAIGVGLWRAQGKPLPLAVGLVSAALLIFYNAVAYRELIRQGEGGEVLKVRWWFTGGASFKGLYIRNREERRRPPLRTLPFRAFTALGRRDLFLFLWLLLALAGQTSVILLYAFLLALFSGIAAAGQLVWKNRR